ncbi:MAG: hypothetical protein ABIG95_05280 [Candidatus Woesearchaeota archaeon]
MGITEWVRANRDIGELAACAAFGLATNYFCGRFAAKSSWWMFAGGLATGWCFASTAAFAIRDFGRRFRYYAEYGNDAIDLVDCLKISVEAVAQLVANANYLGFGKQSIDGVCTVHSVLDTRQGIEMGLLNPFSDVDPQKVIARGYDVVFYVENSCGALNGLSRGVFPGDRHRGLLGVRIVHGDTPYILAYSLRSTFEINPEEPGEFYSLSRVQFTKLYK